MDTETVYCDPYAATALDVYSERTCADRWLRRPIKVGYWPTDANKRMLQVQMASKHFVRTLCGYLDAATTVNGHGCIVTPHRAGSEGVILAKSGSENLALSDV